MSIPVKTILSTATPTAAGLMSAQSVVKLGYLGELIDSQTISAVTSFTPAAWNAGQYREIGVVSKTTGGMSPGNPCKLTFNGDVSANYDALSRYTQGDLSTAANAQFAASAGQLALTGSASVPDMLLQIRIFPLKLTSGHRPFFCDFSAKGTANSTFIFGESRGYWLDTTNDMTFLTLIYGAAATGTVEVRGIPA
jgi:hypothetical protein